MITLICFNCGYKLSSEDTRECNLCGMKMPLKCSCCGCPNPLPAKFCFNCGSPIAKTDIQNSLENYDILSESRKNVAVMFADISGFTSLSEKLDPEEVRSIINECFTYITKPIYELEGTIDKYIGDCVMVLFGAKYAHSDDPRRAVSCALKMMSLIQEFSRERLWAKNIRLDLSIGISYGLVVTGSVGNYFDKDYTVMGDIVNTAQRLQTSAKEGTILVSENIYEETKELFHYIEIGKISVKNKKLPLRCFQPKYAKTEPHHETLLLERDSEMSTMLSIYHHLRTTQCVEITGDPGMGKTSLLKEFVSKVPESVKRVWIECSTSYQNRINSVLSALLHSIMNIAPEDHNDAKKYRLLSYVYYLFGGQSKEEVHKTSNFLSILMGLGRDSDFQNILNSMNYEDIERELVAQLTVFFKGLLKKQAHIFIFDSIQWADSSSITIMNKLVQELSDEKTMFIFASRRDLKIDAVKSEAGYHRIRLNALSTTGTIDMACRLLGCTSVNTGSVDIIQKVTGGNPLYIKEFIAIATRKGHFTIKENAASIEVAEIALLPGTIESFILANLTELDRNTVDFLQLASVIGSEFDLSWIRSLSTGSIDVESAFTASHQANIISVKSVHTASGKIEKACCFTHDTTREVIYNSILNTVRYNLHKSIGEYLEQSHSKDLENFYEILCEHFEKAGYTEKASMYAHKTALKHKGNFNFQNALSYFLRYLEHLSVNRGQEMNQKKVSALIDIGLIYTIQSDFDRALDFLNRALEIAVLTDDIFTIKLMISDIYREKALYAEALSIILEIEPRMRPESSLYGQLLQQKCSILRLQGNPKALQAAKRSEQILLRTKDYNNLSEAMRQAAYIYFAKGDLDNSLYYLNKAYAYAEKINNIGSMARTSRNLGIIYHSSGAVSKALEYFNKSIEISDKISDVQGLLSSKINLGILFMEKGMFDRSEFLFHEVSAHAPKVSLVYQECLALLNLGDLMYEKGNDLSASENYNRSLEIAKKHGLSCEEGINYIGLVKLDFKKGECDRTVDMLEKACQIFSECNEVSYLSDYYKLKSIFEIEKNNYEGALAFCEKSIFSAAEAKSGLKKLRALRLKGILFMLMGKYEKSLDFYTESIQTAIQQESDYEAAKGYYRKSAAYRLLKNEEEANACLAEAKQAVEKVDSCRWKDIILDDVH